ncbi:prohibitin family protein (plasmid) [Kovacikia minuta CCNUW1]|uniref:prohibitin family protein n=1 Tax=Kovacikia minuta TaxID=2931930 RepID=UPI001CCE3E56|nr:prohibitin family protein [Kovacikia minuta]UBF30420.1 prohibitin family protein [Kovacikia minuta CCNUW1]
METLSKLPDLQPIQKSKKSNKDLYATGKVFLALFLLAMLASFFVIINAGERGVLLKFGEVQSTVLGEGIHPIIPIVHTVEKLSVRVQSQEITAEASSRDLQDVYTDVALNWHIVPEETHLIFQQIGRQDAIIQHIINPAVEEVLKAVMATYTAEEIITKRGEVKTGVDQALIERLRPYHIAVDDISLVHVHFSNRFSDAVEAKQVAEQEAKRAEFVALKAVKEAEARVNLAKGEAEAQRLLRENLTPELLQRQVIEKWNGNLPLIVGSEGTKLLDLRHLVETNQAMQAAQPNRADFKSK